METSYDPIHEENGEWFFWDETQADRYGPYASKEEATAMYDFYGKVILGV